MNRPSQKSPECPFKCNMTIMVHMTCRLNAVLQYGVFWKWSSLRDLSVQCVKRLTGNPGDIADAKQNV